MNNNYKAQEDIGSGKIIVINNSKIRLQKVLSKI